MAVRKANHYAPKPGLDIDHFDIQTLNKDNLANQILKITYNDVKFSTIMELFGEFGGNSLCHPYDELEVPIGAYSFVNDKGKVISNKNKILTTLGIWIFNVVFSRDAGYGFLLGYINDNINAKKLDNIHQDIAFALLENKISVESYKKWIDTADWFMPFETILCPNHTEEVLTCTKKINVKKKELAKKYKEQLDKGDIAAAEKMEKELLEYAKEILKDNPGLDPLQSGGGGDWGNNFKNLYVMRGAVLNPDPNAHQKFDVALSSYVDGISADEYAFVSNTLAHGAFSRNKKTEAGGYWENLVSDACSTITIDPPGSDCGTKKYALITLTDKNYKDFMYSYIIKSNGQLEELTSDTVKQYIGKTVKMRLSIYCNSKTGFCHHCAGNFFYRRGSNKAGLALSLVPNKLKLTAMKSFHSSVINTAEIDVMKAFFN